MAQQRLQTAVGKFDPARTSTADAVQRAQTRLDIAQRNNLREQFTEATVQAQPFLRVLGLIEKQARESIETFRRYNQQILTISSLTGAGRNQSSQTLGLLGAAGISGGGIKEILSAGKAAFSGEGAGALAMLGIVPQTGQSSIQVFDQIIDKLAGIKDGMLKTRVATEIFGESGAEALQPLLRMSQEARDQIRKFSDGLGDSAEASQRLTEAQSVLNAGWQAMDVRIGAALAPALTGLSKIMIGLLDIFDDLNKKTGNLGTLAVIFIATTAAIFSVIKVVMALNAVMKTTVVLQSVLAALKGNWAGLGAAAAVGVGAAGVIGAGMYIDGNNSPAATADRMGEHVANFGRAVNQFGSNLDEFRSRIMPGGMTDADLSRMNYNNSQMAIG